MKQVSSRLLAIRVAAALLVLVLSSGAHAAPIVFDVSGTARALADNLGSVADIDKTVPITFPGNGSVESDDTLTLTCARTTWTLSESDTVARFEFALFAFGGRGGEGRAEGHLKFKTLDKGRFKLLLRFPVDYGGRTVGQIDGDSREFSFNFQNPEPGGEKILEGELAAGEHTFAAETIAAQTRSNPLRTDGTVTLEVTQDVAAIPLPAAVYPGLVMLGAAGLWVGRKRLS